MKIKKQMAMLVCFFGIWMMAAVIVLTVQANASEMPGEENPFQCQLESHNHTVQCYGDSAKPVCGYADFIVHTHEGLCYDGSGNLRCPLPEIRTHIHGDGCYGPMEADDRQPILWRQVLLCPERAVCVHVHTDRCLRDGKWVCGKQQVLEHQHTQNCIPEELSRKEVVDWVGLGQVSMSPFTKMALLQMGAGVLLLILQIWWKREITSAAEKQILL